MEAPNHYEVLCVDPRATADQIRVAYRRLIRVYHPDVATEAGEAMTLRLNAAQHELLDPVLRAQYDRTLRSYSSEPPRSSQPTRSYRMPRENRQPRPEPTFSQTYAQWSNVHAPSAPPAAPFDPVRFRIWFGLTLASIAVVLASTTFVFFVSYSGPLTLLSPRMLPPIVVGLTWLVAVMRRPPKLLLALMVIGAGLWPLTAFGVDPFTRLASLPPLTLPSLTALVVAVILFRTAAPKAVELSARASKAPRSRVA